VTRTLKSAPKPARQANGSERLKADRPEQVVGLLLKSLNHTLRQTVDEAMRARGVQMSFAHFATLYTLYSEPGIAGAQLARRVTIAAQTMNSILRRLERERLIERRPHPESRRADSWFPTERGTAQLDRARSVLDSVFSRMLSALSETEVEELQNYLRRCIAALETAADAGAKTPGRHEARRRGRETARRSA
jgi:DNA-binding MarR family transcriptional regulator